MKNKSKARQSRLSRDRSNPNKDRVGSPRTVDVTTQDWADFETAAKLAGVTRNTFIVTCTRHAAQQFLGAMKRDKTEVLEAVITDTATQTSK